MATLIFKCTERCNSRCVYCDVSRSHAGTLDASAPLLGTLFSRLNEFLAERPHETILFTWHGGEPLLMGPDFFGLAYELQEKHCRNTKSRITHCMQSNLTLLTDEFIPALQRLGIRSIGTSYDPEPHMRGFGDAVDSIAYNRAFLRATSLLEKHGMTWGFIYVVTRRSLADPVRTFLTLGNLKPAGGFNINPVVTADGAVVDYAISPEEFADFLGAVFPVWFAHRDRYPHVEPFDSLMANVESGEGSRLTCDDSGGCAGHHLNVDPAGNVSQCGRSSDLGIMPWGNLADTSLAESLRRSRETFGGRTRKLREAECGECRLFALCHGGCPIEGYLRRGSYGDRTRWCAARQRFISKYFEPTTGLTVQGLKDWMGGDRG